MSLVEQAMQSAAHSSERILNSALKEFFDKIGDQMYAYKTNADKVRATPLAAHRAAVLKQLGEFDKLVAALRVNFEMELARFDLEAGEVELWSAAVKAKKRLAGPIERLLDK